MPKTRRSNEEPSRASVWGAVVRQAHDVVERNAVWDCVKKIYEAVNDIMLNDGIEVGFAQADLAKESGVALAKIKARYETIAFLKESRADDIVSEPNSNYENVQAVVRSTNEELSDEARMKIIRRMDKQDKDAKTKTSYAHAKHYCHTEGMLDPRDKGKRKRGPFGRQELDTPGRIADALQAILDNSKTAPATVRRMPEYKGLRGFIKKLRSMGDK